MIKVLDTKTQKFIEYLNKNYPLKNDVKLMPLWGWDAVQSDDTGDVGFAVFNAKDLIIMLPMEIPANVIALNDKELLETFTIGNLAHEYCHAMQLENNSDFSEEEADEFSEKVVLEFMQEGKDD